ncbi:MAG: ATP phosphoribosyltransferase [Planctomycetes bacterium]|nr:ATP phosphoribosyltransferase [Planctomycetota bacterium]
MIIELGLPKGSLQDATLDLLARAGFHFSVRTRSYFPATDDPEIEAMLVRAQEMARYVEEGILDAGITGHDWVLESGADVVEVAELVYSKATRRPARWVLAVHETSAFHTPRDLEGKRIATEVVSITRAYLERLGIRAEVEFSWGATEVKVPELVDAIVELTETGASLRENRLRVIDEVLVTTTRLIANRESLADPEKRRKIETIALLLLGAIEAQGKVGLKMNAPREGVDAILAILPAMRRPTVSSLHGEDWVAIETVLDEEKVRAIIPELKRLGARDIIEYPLNKVIH